MVLCRAVLCMAGVPHCDNFSGYDSVFVLEVEDGKVTSMKLEADGSFGHGFQDGMDEEFTNACAVV